MTVYWEPPGPELRWLEALLALHLATIRLTFVGDNLIKNLFQLPILHS
jgi:hypothetical protein